MKKLISSLLITVLMLSVVVPVSAGHEAATVSQGITLDAGEMNAIVGGAVTLSCAFALGMLVLDATVGAGIAAGTGGAGAVWWGFTMLRDIGAVFLACG